MHAMPKTRIPHQSHKTKSSCCCFGFFWGGVFVFYFIFEKVSLCSSGCPRTHRDLFASASEVLGLKACATPNSTRPFGCLEGPEDVGSR